MKQNKSSPGFTIIDMDTSFVNSVVDYEQYALLYTKNAGHGINGYLKITGKGKSIYRKVRGRNGVNSNELAIAYRTQKELEVKVNDPVYIKPAGFFAYYWYNSEKYTKHAFRIAIAGLFLTVVSSIASLIQIVVSAFLYQ